MCGRFTRYKTWREIHDYLSLFLGDHDKSQSAPNLPPRYNIAPTQGVEIVKMNDWGTWRIDSLRWGLLPPWSKDTSWASKMINARAETVTEKRSFSAAFKARRCLVPADGYYEWKKEQGGKQPYRITLRGEALMLFAGLWEKWEIKEGVELSGAFSEHGAGDVIESFTILTTHANEMTADIHNRMPVTLDEDEIQQWMDPNADAGFLKELVNQPYSGRRMTAYPVSKAVNSVKNIGPELIESV
jgi:putative SOS response-associated peptidase YedK